MPICPSLVPGVPLAWPGGARLAFAVVVNLEHVDWMPPRGTVRPAGFPGPYGGAPYPDVRAWSHREYGNRVGAFRVLDILERCDLKVSAAIDALTANSCPDLVARIRSGGCELVGHGIAVTRLISQLMTEDQERAYVVASLNALEQTFGTRPVGWHGPEYGQSARTPTVLSSLGLRYMLDYPDDEQPRRIATGAGAIVSLPVMVELDDVFAHWQRRIPLDRWVRSFAEAVDQLVDDGEQNGRVLVLNLHPWLIGQPWRSTYLREALAEISRRDDIWSATCGEIVTRAEPQLPAFPPRPGGPLSPGNNRGPS